jgi:hypothetical protein
VAPLPEMSPRAGRKGSMLSTGGKKTGKRGSAVSFAVVEDGGDDDDGEESLREGVSEMADGATRRQAAASIGENNVEEETLNKQASSNRSRAASLRPSISNGALSSLMDAASDDLILEQMYAPYLFEKIK